MNPLRLLLAVFTLSAVIVFAMGTELRAEDWPQWGQDNTRNSVSDEKGIPDGFTPGKKRPDGSGVDLATTKNVKWVVPLGTENYSSPVVAANRVIIGSNDVNLKDPRYKSTGGGLLRCFDEATGKLLWKLVVPKLEGVPKSEDFDNLELGICGTAAIDGNRVYIVTNRNDVLCLDVEGMANGNDGPFKGERQYTGALSEVKPGVVSDDADIIWRFDMLKELSVFPHDAASCSVLIQGDIVYVATGNGVDNGKCPYPLAPSFIALDKHTGKLVAKDDELVGTRMFHGQWSSPCIAPFADKNLVVFGGGDGICYAFQALDKSPTSPGFLRKVWSCDCNPPEYRMKDGKAIDYWDGDCRKDRGNTDDGTFVGPSEIIGTPVFYKNRIYVTIGQDPLHGWGKGCLTCIDATKTGDLSETGKIWTFTDIQRSLSSPTICDDLLFTADIAGVIYCLDSETGQCYWKYDAKTDNWNTPLVVDGKVYIGNRKSLLIFAASKEKKLIRDIRLGTQVRAMPVVSDGVLYVASQRYLWAVQKGAKPVALGAEKSPVAENKKKDESKADL